MWRFFFCCCFWGWEEKFRPIKFATSKFDWLDSFAFEELLPKATAFRNQRFQVPQEPPVATLSPNENLQSPADGQRKKKKSSNSTNAILAVAVPSRSLPRPPLVRPSRSLCRLCPTPNFFNRSRRRRGLLMRFGHRTEEFVSCRPFSTFRPLFVHKHTRLEEEEETKRTPKTGFESGGREIPNPSDTYTNGRHALSTQFSGNFAVWTTVFELFLKFLAALFFFWAGRRDRTETCFSFH